MYRALDSSALWNAPGRNGSSAPDGTSEQSITDVTFSVLVHVGQQPYIPDDVKPTERPKASPSVIATQVCNRASNGSSGYGSAGSMACIQVPQSSTVRSSHYSSTFYVISKYAGLKSKYLHIYDDAKVMPTPQW